MTLKVFSNLNDSVMQFYRDEIKALLYTKCRGCNFEALLTGRARRTASLIASVCLVWLWILKHVIQPLTTLLFLLSYQEIGTAAENSWVFFNI